MKTSAAGVHFVSCWEGMDRKGPGGLYYPYKDAVSYSTIGVGHLILPGEDFSAGITKERVLQILANDLTKREMWIDEKRLLDWTQNQFDAMVSAVFNLGTGLLSSVMMRRLNLGDFEAFPTMITAYVHAGGRVLPGLVARRAAEAKLWQTRDFEPTPEEPVSAKLAALNLLPLEWSDLNEHSDPAAQEPKTS